MAGAGVRVFQPGEVLTAALVNTYLQDQVVCRFDDTTDRDGSFGGAGQPVLEEGRICYLDSTNELQYFDGSVWVTISPEAVTSTVEAKGDLIVGTAANTIDNLSVGADDRVLTAKSSTATGLSWEIPSVPDGAITEAKLATNAVTTDKIASNAITSDKIAPGTVIAADIAAGTITVTELADGAVTSAKILDGTILNADISASAGIALTKLSSDTTTALGVGTVELGHASDTTLARGSAGRLTVKGVNVVTISSTDTLTNKTIALGSNTISGTKAQFNTAVTDDDIAYVGTANAFTANQTVTGTVTTQAASTQDAVVLQGRAGGTSSRSVTITPASLSASRTLTLPDTTGTVITTGDSGTVTSTMIADGTIVNADISSTAAIDIGKIADVTIDTKTANYTLALTDKNKFIEMNLSSANTVSVPTNASVAFPIGSQIHITQYGTGKTQIVAVTPATTNIRSTPGAYLRAQYSSATLIKRATDEWYLVGDLSAT